MALDMTHILIVIIAIGVILGADPKRLWCVLLLLFLFDLALRTLDNTSALLPEAFSAVTLGVALLYSYLSWTPWMARLLALQLPSVDPISPDQLETLKAGAIIVLGNGSVPNAPEFGGDTLNDGGLTRVRYGAWLHRRTGFPILLSGGGRSDRLSEATLMRAILQEEMGVPVSWLEEKSATTWENACYSRDLLAPLGIDTVLVVTHARHIPRAAWCFKKCGFNVIPAPTRFDMPSISSMLNTQQQTISPLLPNQTAGRMVRRIMHEHIGMLYYRLRYRRRHYPDSRRS
ncbi:MAG: YdcF family protein [Magnetococcales bacterium]|nr:YdcF family protein [Magnetococcales bacterium]